MRNQILLIGLLFFAIQGIAAPVDVAKAVHYTPLSNFYGGTFGAPRTDPGDNPFSMNGPEFLDYMNKNDRCDLITFQLGFAGAYVGAGKVVKFLPTEPTDLKKYLEAEYNGRFPNITPAVIDEIDGLTSVSLTATRPPGPIRPYFLYFRWIQIKTNMVVKIEAVSCNTNTFMAVSNSIRSIKIDKTQLLKALSMKD